MHSNFSDHLHDPYVKLLGPGKSGLSCSKKTDQNRRFPVSEIWGIPASQHVSASHNDQNSGVVRKWMHRNCNLWGKHRETPILLYTPLEFWCILWMTPDSPLDFGARPATGLQQFHCNTAQLPSPVARPKKWPKVPLSNPVGSQQVMIIPGSSSFSNRSPGITDLQPKNGSPGMTLPSQGWSTNMALDDAGSWHRDATVKSKCGYYMF